MGKDEPFLRSKEVAHILNISPDAIYEPVRKGELRALKWGRIWLFRHEDVMAYKEAQEKKLAIS